MLFYLFILLSLIASAVIAALNFPWWGAILAFFPIAGFMIVGAFAFAGLISMWLGRKSKFGLRGTQTWEVQYRDSETLYCPKTGETLHISELTETLSSAKFTTPTLVVKRYNITGWRYRWLMDIYPDTIEYILYLPSEDEAS